jgi:hypothetical protein
MIAKLAVVEKEMAVTADYKYILFCEEIPWDDLVKILVAAQRDKLGLMLFIRALCWSAKLSELREALRPQVLSILYLNKRRQRPRRLKRLPECCSESRD